MFCELLYRDEELIDVCASPTLKELLDLAAYLQQSEANLKQLISKYIQDDNAAKELSMFYLLKVKYTFNINSYYILQSKQYLHILI